MTTLRTRHLSFRQISQSHPSGPATAIQIPSHDCVDQVRRRREVAALPWPFQAEYLVYPEASNALVRVHGQVRASRRMCALATPLAPPKTLHARFRRILFACRLARPPICSPSSPHPRCPVLYRLQCASLWLPPPLRQVPQSNRAPDTWLLPLCRHIRRRRCVPVATKI